MSSSQADIVQSLDTSRTQAGALVSSSQSAVGAVSLGISSSFQWNNCP
jgi:hypothetical protein